MVQFNDPHTKFWQYLPKQQKDLIMEGQFLMNNIIKESAYSFKDYSFLVFPFAKTYEGFLKLLFKDIKFISHLDYISNHFRIGKVMSPNLVKRLRERSLYQRITKEVDRSLADKIWFTWKNGRNQIFHYFPHNFKAITFQQAENTIKQILETMIEAYNKLEHFL